MTLMSRWRIDWRSWNPSEVLAMLPLASRPAEAELELAKPNGAKKTTISGCGSPHSAGSWVTD